MMKKTILLILFFTALESGAQSRYSIFLNSGYSFSNSLHLNDEKVKNSRGYILTLGGSLKLFSIKNKDLVLGMAGKTIFATGSINEKKFTSTTLRLLFPLQILFPLTEKWAVSTGFNFQNNIDLTTTDLKLGDKYLLRIDYLAGMKYFLTNQWSLTGSININLRDIPDLYFLNDPKFAILIGVEKQLIKKRKTKNKL